MRVIVTPRYACVLLFVLAFALRLTHVVWNSFDGLYGQDAYAYYGYAREMFAAVTQGQLPPAFWWPLGYPALLSAAFGLGGVSIAAAQGITLLAGALTAPLAFLLAYEAVGEKNSPTSAQLDRALVAGWIAGLLCAVCGQLVQSSVVIMADAPAVMWTTAAGWLLLRYARTNDWRTLALACVALGFGVWTRWQNLIVAAVWFVALVVIQVTRTREGTDAARGRTGRWLPIVLAAGIVILVLMPQLMIRTITDAPLAGQAWLEGWGVTNFWGRSFDTPDGHFDYALPIAVFYAQVFLHPAYLVFLLTPVFLIGIGALVGQARRGAWGTAMLLLGWIGAMFLFLAGIPYENFRFSLGLFPPVAAVTGLGGAWVWARWRMPWVRLALAGWVAVSLLVMLVWQPRVLAPVIESKVRERAQAEWLQETLPKNAMLWTMGIDGAIGAYTPLKVRNLWEHSPQELRANPTAYLFVDVPNMEAQWKDKPPGQLYRALMEAGALQQEGVSEGWTLFKIK